MVLFRRLLGDVLRDRRMQRGMTLREVSAEARVSLGYISEIERGQKEASSELLASLCAALDVPLSDVLREVSDAVAARGGRASRRHPDHGRRARRAPATWSPPPPDAARRSAGAARLAGRAPVRRPLAAGGSRHRHRDRRAAAAARLRSRR